MIALVSFGAAWLLAASGSRELTWPGVRKEITRRHPAAAGITTAALARWLADSARVAPLLLDVRAREEYETSHLPGAVWADAPARRRELLRAAPPARPVVGYCSVGLRSARAAEEIGRAGPRDVLNLDGGLFQWANEGRPLRRGDRPVRVVHPFDRRWGRLLDTRLWPEDWR